ncbi:Hypothetical predicted protein [Paramuricea clavata]|uniref:Uncharacterized protein n=2 Tax=Paramuricea clavata TaxID=317549 RepID=A0A6S7I2Z4_PARCT|nr:Hypothetical predicted protein [Paramuricea clavata]
MFYIVLFLQMRNSIVILCFVVCVVAYTHAQSPTTTGVVKPTTKSPAGLTTKSPSGAQTSPPSSGSPASTNNGSSTPTKPATSKPTSGVESSSAIFGLVLAFAFSCLVKNL